MQVAMTLSIVSQFLVDNQAFFGKIVSRGLLSGYNYGQNYITSQNPGEVRRWRNACPAVAKPKV